MLAPLANDPGSRDPADRSDGIGRLLFCTAGRWLCALPVVAVEEIMRPLPLEALAGAPACVLGLAAIRGQPVPVLDLARMLGSADATIGRFVAVRAGGRQVACAVGSVVGIRRIPDELLGRLPPLLREADAGLVAAVGVLDQELLVVLDAARLASTEVLGGIAIEGPSP